MRIYLPWKIKGYDNKKHYAFISIEYGHVQHMKSFLYQQIKEKILKEIEEDNKKKKNKGSLRKCPGHKNPKTPVYVDGVCSICGGYKR